MNDAPLFDEHLHDTTETASRDPRTEKLAELLHLVWSNQARYMLDNLSEENVLYWREKIATPYAVLAAEGEAAADRAMARDILALLEER